MSSAQNNDQTGLQPVASDYIQLIYHAFCFFLGFPLNLVTLLRLAYRFKKTKSRVFMLHINLNISDLMVLLFFCFGRVCWLLTYQWMGGERLCKLMRFLEALSFSISSNIVVCIGLDRAHSILCPLQASSHMTLGAAVKIFIAWMLSVAVALPQVFVWSVYSTKLNGKMFTQCVTHWTIKIQKHTNTSADEFHQKVYEATYLFGLFWIPLAILLVSYIIILTSIFKNFGGRQRYTACPMGQINKAADSTEENKRRSTQQQVTTQEESAVQMVKFGRTFQVAEDRRQQTRYRTLRVTVILLSLYVVCWLPYNTLGWWQLIDSKSFQLVSDRVYFLHGLVVLNSVINPFVYGRFQLTNCCPTEEDIQNMPHDDHDISSQFRRNSSREDNADSLFL